jgi:uncharacterized protein YecT (DUF1311 family)
MKKYLFHFLASALFGWLAISAVGQAAPAPAPAPRPVKTLTPRQQEQLRKQATTAYDAVTHGIDACPVRADQPLVDWRACLAGAVTKTEAAYKSYNGAVRALLLTPKPEEVSDPGMQRWYADNTRDFDAASRAWLSYYKAQCQSETSTVEPGSGMAETQANCQLALLKERGQRVNEVYGQMVGLTAAK